MSVRSLFSYCLLAFGSLLVRFWFAQASCLSEPKACLSEATPCQHRAKCLPLHFTIVFVISVTTVTFCKITHA